MERYYDNPGIAGTLGGAKGQVVIAEEVRKASAPKASRAGLAAGLGAGIAAGVASQFGPTLIANIWDRNKLGQCQKELGLNESEMKVLSNGSTFSLMEPKASTASIGRIKASCSDLWLQNPADSLVTIKRENGGEIPSGTCQMMKNELVRIMSLYPKESDVQVADCNKLKAPNFEVSGDGPNKTFLYTSSPSHLLKVPFDGQSAWPDYTLAVVEVNRLVDRRLTEEFRQRHQRPLASDVSKDNLPRWDLQEMLPCMTTDTKATEECRIQKAAVAARYYYSEYRQSCMRKRNMPAGSSSTSGKGRTDSTR